MLKLVRRSLLLGAIAFAPAALSPAGAAAAAERLNVVATFSIIGDFAARVGGERIELSTLVGPNGDAHVYEPKPADAVAMAGADVVLVNGLHFEGFLERLVETSGTKAPVVELTRGVETIGMGEENHGDEGQAHQEEAGHAHSHGDIDPHAFQSVANVKVYVKNIAEAFCGADPEGCGAYRRNADAYTAELDKLEAEVKDAVAAIPAEKRTIITSHDAFGYFAHEYGLTFHAPEGVSTESEASAADVARLIEEIREEKAAAVFVENVSNPRLIEQIASETGLKVGGELYSDALSDPSGPAGTYLDLIRHNIRTLKGAILGS